MEMNETHRKAMDLAVELNKLASDNQIAVFLSMSFLNEDEQFIGETIGVSMVEGKDVNLILGLVRLFLEKPLVVSLLQEAIDAHAILLKGKN